MNPFSLARRGLLATALALLAGSAIGQGGKDCAVVLLHGKWGNPQAIGYFGRKLEPACSFKALEMPWSQRREYDKPYPGALQEIAAQVKAFRADGYRRVLVAGHSFGANAALAYMAEVGDADGVIALAPGHAPEFMYARGIGKDGVDQARELVAAGKGGERVRMEDLNQRARRSFSLRADVVLSYFDPQGLGHMPLTITRFRKPVPLLWAIGTGDRLHAAGPQFAFERAPAHPASKYLVVEADHMGTPDAAVPGVLEWIRSLP